MTSRTSNAAVSRRALLGALGAAGLVGATSTWNRSPSTGAATASAAPAPGRRIPHRTEEHRAVIVGSGFGGGIAALRLAEAGVPTVLLERGRRWVTGPNATTFPTPGRPDERMLWLDSAALGMPAEIFGHPLQRPRSTGILEASTGVNMTVVCSTGLGGGSLVYQGMSLQPTEEIFSDWFPSGLDWRELDTVHYPRVARMLGLAEAPDALVESPSYAASRHFARRVRESGLPLRKIPMPIDWDYALAELRGEMRPAYTNGDCSLGVNNGGKNSVDVTYIARAEATGRVDVLTLHDVTGVFREPDGRWRVEVDVLDVSGTVLETLTLRTAALVMAAGSVNTTKLLVRAGATGAIPDLPETLGQGWGTNADRIYLWTDPTAGFGPVQGGPVVYGSLNWADRRNAHTLIQASLPPLGLEAHTTVMVGYGVSADRGHVAYDPATDAGVLHWPEHGDAGIVHDHISRTARTIAGPTGHLTDTNNVLNSTWHPLGGAVMGSSCDLDGRVLGQRGLYVVDGALIPGTTAACNPSFTIAALAERALDRIVRHDVGTVF